MRNDTTLLSEVLGLAGMLILENGGDTHRAEETAERICDAAGRPGSDVLALPTGIMITIAPYCGVSNNVFYADGERPPITCAASPDGPEEDYAPVSIIRRVKKRTINLSKIERVNRAARSFTSGKITLSETLAMLKEIDKAPKSNRFISSIYAGISSGLFALLFGGSWFEFSISFACGFIVQLLAAAFKRSSIFHFAISLIGGAIIAAIAVTVTAIVGFGNVDLIIIGSIMALLPGLAMTNAIRDAMMGDLVSGVARFADVMLISLSLAGGVGLVLSAYISFGGVLR
jgi:Uncharacterized conserved protein